MTLQDEVEQFYDVLEAGERACCPVCARSAKIYRRPLNRGMAESLRRMYQDHGTEWQTIGLTKQREESKLVWWGLVERGTETREEGGSAGRYRVTELGEDWLLGDIRVRKYAFDYAGNCLELTGPEIRFEDAMGEPFTGVE